jgi:Double zinc ribbon
MTTKQPTQCPRCRQPASGQFCANCGTALSLTCPGCGAVLTRGTRFCKQCGRGLDPAQDRADASPVAWVALGLAAVALVVATFAVFRGPGRQPVSPPTSSAPLASRPAPDISNMTPREAADSLFNRIMRAHEAGNADEAMRFRPMALQAYQMIGALDADARYHIGLIHAVTGNVSGAQAQTDSIRLTEPKHLLATMLAFTIAQLQGERDAGLAAYRFFLANYDAEIATDKPEYRDHQRALDGFRQDALRTVGNGS